MLPEKKPRMLRLQDDMHEKIRYIAYVEHRSINAQIEQAISAYIDNFEQSHGEIKINH